MIQQILWFPWLPLFLEFRIRNPWECAIKLTLTESERQQVHPGPHRCQLGPPVPPPASSHGLWEGKVCGQCARPGCEKNSAEGLAPRQPTAAATRGSLPVTEALPGNGEKRRVVRLSTTKDQRGNIWRLGRNSSTTTSLKPSLFSPKIWKSHFKKE